MKVSNIHNTLFRGKANVQQPIDEQKKYPQVKELSTVTPDFGVSIPQNYKKIGVTTLDNGLEIHQYRLANGHKVSIVPMQDSPAVVKNYVNVGSMNETANIKGISHFLEHMAFNGTNGENGHVKLEVGDSFKKIDELGGWANASTNYAVTDYVNSSPLLKDSDLETQIRVIAAMTEDLKLSDDMIAKEKKPVCSEINMILDDPETIVMDQAVRTLFNIKNPTDEMVGGSVKSIKNLTRKDVVNYYNKYYTPDNMNLVITGDVDPEEAIKIVSKSFNSRKIAQGKKFEEKLVPIEHTVRKDFVSDKANLTNIMLAFAGPKNNADAKDKIAYDLAKSYIQSYSVGLKQNLREFNTYAFVDDQKIGTNPNTPKMTYILTNSTDSKSEQVLKTVFNTIGNAKPVSEQDLETLKERLLKNREECFEYSSSVNDIVGNAVLDGSMDYVSDYETIINSLTTEDVNKALKTYFDLNKAAVTLVHPEESSISFKGRSENRTPINLSKVSEYKLDNNFHVGFYETASKNINYNISLNTDKPYDKKAGAIEVLNEIYSMGTNKLNEKDWNEFKEKNNLKIHVGASPFGIKVFSESGSKNYNLMLQNAQELLYNPRITQDTLDKAKENIKESILYSENTADSLYMNFESENLPFEFTDDEILDSIDSLTIDDIKECQNYLLNNSRGIITANIPDREELKSNILKSANSLKNVMPNEVQVVQAFKENQAPIVLRAETNNSQADIMQVYKFKCNNTIKESALGEVLNSILTNSSIGLFNVLREKQHLAYSVYSDMEKLGNSGEISCHILTTTDNKSIGEISYDNVQKSIEGFKNQINELKAGNFTDQDLENAKMAIKADLIQNEGSAAKLSSIGIGLNSTHGIEYLNKLYEAVDSITKEDITEFAERIFSQKPVYSIAATKDTLDYNETYFDKLEQES